MIELMDPSNYKIVGRQKVPVAMYPVLNNRHIAKLDDEAEPVLDERGNQIFEPAGMRSNHVKYKNACVLQDLNGDSLVVLTSEMMQSGWSRGQVKRMLKEYYNSSEESNE